MKNKRNWLYLAGPLALVSYGLMDYVGGMNYPGFNWMNQSLSNLTAWDSYCLPISLTFSIVAGVLIIVAGYLVYKFFKKFKTNKTFSKGIACVLLVALIAGIGTNACQVKEAGTFAYVQDLCAEIQTQQTTIDDANKAINEAKANASEEGSDDASSSSDSTITSNESKIETANQQIEQTRAKVSEKLLEPMTLSRMIAEGLLTLAVLFAALLLGIGGLKKKGIKTIGIFAICLGVLIITAMVLSFTVLSSYTGITGRFVYYCPYLLVAFIAAWVYVYVPAEK